MPTLDTTEQGFQIPQIDTVVRGDSRRLRFTVTVDSTPKDLTGDTLRWGLFDREYQSDFSSATLSDADADVTIRTDPITDPTAGEFEVKIEEGAFGVLAGEYFQRVVVDPVGGSRQTWRGRLLVEQ